MLAAVALAVATMKAVVIDVPAVHKRIEAGRVLGKVVLKIC